MMADDGEEEKKDLDLSSTDVVTKYKMAAEVTNKALALVASKCVPGAKIVDICDIGDKFITEACAGVYKTAKKKIEKGIAFPTCISVNNCACHFSPVAGDEASLHENEVVKIDLGCNIDGFVAMAAHTLSVVPEGAPVTGRAADVIQAALTGAEVALRLVRPGHKNHEVTAALEKVAAAYDCHVVEGVLSHQMKQFVIDANKVVLSVGNAETRVEDFEFLENEVYAVDVVMSTGEGKLKMLDERQTTIYKRAMDKAYNLKMKASRSIFSEINTKHPFMPFTARSLEDKRAKLGLVECVNHELLHPYPVLFEKPGELVSHIKFTVLLMPNGSDKITNIAPQSLQPTKTLEDPEILALLSQTVKKKKGGGKKKKGKKAEGDEMETEDGDEGEKMDTS